MPLKTDTERLADANDIIRGKNGQINALKAELRRLTGKKVKISYGPEETRATRGRGEAKR
jgi:hypothetical protein